MTILDLNIKVIIQDYQDIMGRISGSYIEIALVAVSVYLHHGMASVYLHH